MSRQRRERHHHIFNPYQPRPLNTRINTPDQLTAYDIRKTCIDRFEKKTRVEKDDKTNSKELVDNILKNLITEVRLAPGGELYGHNVTNAGSYPVNTKIGKADEFDTNIPLNLSLERVQRKGTIKYSFETPNDYNTMRYGFPTEKRLQHAVYPVDIPPGHRVIEIDRASVQSKFEHRVSSSTHHLHSSYIMWGIPPRQEIVLNRGKVEDCIQLIPKDIKDDLLLKLRRAITTLNLGSIVSLQRTAHGPALTLVYKSGTIESVQHNISIDIVASVSFNVNMSAFQWPRRETMRAFSADLIDRVLEAGTHLVPKHDLFWSVSFSRMERALQSGMDAGFGCRKFVLRILKKFVQKWKSQDSKIRNISSHILKTQLFWSCEMHCDEPHYWHRSNRDLCLINTMEELVGALRDGELLGYFFAHRNLLGGKPDWLLLNIADYISEKRRDLTLLPTSCYLHQDDWIKYGDSILRQ